MKRAVAFVLSALVVAAALFWPVVFTAGGAEDQVEPDPATISMYRADFEVDEDGTLTAVETLTVDMPFGRHGIFRFWDILSQADPHVRLIPRDIEVTVDGEEAEFETYSEGNGRFRVAKIGDADVTLTPGEHTYVIEYNVEDALSPGEDDSSSQFYWSLIPSGWGMSIDEARLTVKLPASASDLRCGVGLGENPPPCDLQGDGTDELRVRTGALSPRTPVTVQTTLDLATPERDTVPWTGRFDPVLGRSVVAVVMLLVLSGVALMVGLMLSLRSRESAPGLPVMYAPPEGIGPVQAAYVMDETVPSQAMTATLLYQAEQGLTKLTRTESDDWIVAGIGTPEQWQAADPVTYAVGKKLGVTTQGKEFRADGSVGAGTKLQGLDGTVKSTTSAWAKTAGLLVSSPLASLGVLMFFGAAILAGLIFFFNPFSISLLGLPPAAYVIGAAPLLVPGSTTRRTFSGRDLWSRAGGFKRLLSTPSSEARFDFSAKQELYTAFIPWAVAFGCAAQWEQKYVTEMGQPAPTPSWLYGTHTGYYAGASLASSLSSFESSVQSSISAYQATQSSSSSSSGGGGGFSGGGGGGGGGGGSW